MSEQRCVGEHDDEKDAEVGLLCLDCYSRLRSTLTELPAVATWLEVNIAAGGTPMAERVTGSSEDPIPLRVDVLDIIGPVAPDTSAATLRLDEATIDQLGDPSMFDELRSWAALVEEENGRAWEDRQTLTGVVSYLAGLLTWIAAQPWVDEFAAQVTLLQRRAHRVAPWKTPRFTLSDPCVHCGVRAVVANVGEGWRRCEPKAGGCGRKEHLSEYELRVLLPETRRTA